MTSPVPPLGALSGSVAGESESADAPRLLPLAGGLIPPWLLAAWPAIVVGAVPLAYAGLDEPLTVALTQSVAAVLAAVQLQSPLFRPGDGWSRWFKGFAGLWLAVLAVASANSIDPSNSAQILNKVIGLLWILVSCRYALRIAGAGGMVAFTAAVVLLGHGSLGIAQFLHGMSMPASWVDPAQTGIVSARSHGLFADPNIYAAHLVSLIPWVLAGFLAVDRLGSGVIYWLGLAAGGIGVMVSHSRAGYFSLLAGLVVLFVLSRPPRGAANRGPSPRPSDFARDPAVRLSGSNGPLDPASLKSAQTAAPVEPSAAAPTAVADLSADWAVGQARAGFDPVGCRVVGTVGGAPRLGLSLLAVLLAVVFFGGPFWPRFLSSFNAQDMTVSQRRLINRAFREASDRVPPLGFGLGTFNLVYPQFRVVGGQYPLYAHNEWLQSWLEAGPAAPVLLALMLGLLLLRTWIRWWRRTGPLPWGEVAGAASLTSLAVQNLSGFSARIYPTSVMIALAVAAILAGWSRPDAAPRLFLRRGQGVTIGLALIGVFMVISLKNLHLQVAMASAAGHLAQQRVLAADSVLHGVLLLNPSHAEAHLLRSRVALANGQPLEATLHADRALALNPHEALYWRHRGHLAALASGPAAQLPYLRQTVALDPASEHFRLELARLLIELGRPTEAIAELDAALARSPGWHEVYRSYQEVERLRDDLRAGRFASGSVGLGSAPPHLPVSELDGPRQEEAGAVGETGAEFGPADGGF